MACSCRLSVPRKKKGADNLRRDPPLPIPIRDVVGGKESKGGWRHYIGTLRGDVVVVERLEDMTFLHRMVSFWIFTFSKEIAP